MFRDVFDDILGARSSQSDDFSINESWARRNPDAAQGQLVRNQDRLFDRKFRDYEDAAIDFAGDLSAADTAADNAKMAATNAFGGNETTRQLSRYGRSPSEGLSAALSRSNDLASARAQVKSANQTREGVKDIQTETSASVMNIGQGISQNASQSLSTAGSMASERQLVGEQRSAQRKQSLVSTGMTIAAAAAFGI